MEPKVKRHSLDKRYAWTDGMPFEKLRSPPLKISLLYEFTANKERLFDEAVSRDRNSKR